MDEMTQPSAESDVLQPPAESEVPARPKDNLLSRWVLICVELAASGVLSFFGTIEIYHIFSAIQYEGGKAVTSSVMTLLPETHPEWVMVLTAVQIVFFAVFALFLVPLVVKRLRTIAALCVMLASTVMFTVCHAVLGGWIVEAWSQKTIGSIPYEAELSDVGMIFYIVSCFAMLEMVLAIIAIVRRRKEEKRQCGECG